MIFFRTGSCLYLSPRREEQGQKKVKRKIKRGKNWERVKPCPRGERGRGKRKELV